MSTQLDLEKLSREELYNIIHMLDDENMRLQKSNEILMESVKYWSDLYYSINTQIENMNINNEYNASYNDNSSNDQKQNTTSNCLTINNQTYDNNEEGNSNNNRNFNDNNDDCPFDAPTPFSSPRDGLCNRRSENSSIKFYHQFNNYLLECYDSKNHNQVNNDINNDNRILFNIIDCDDEDVDNIDTCENTHSKCTVEDQTHPKAIEDKDILSFFGLNNHFEYCQFSFHITVILSHKWLQYFTLTDANNSKNNNSNNNIHPSTIMIATVDKMKINEIKINMNNINNNKLSTLPSFQKYYIQFNEIQNLDYIVAINKHVLCHETLQCALNILTKNEKYPVLLTIARRK